MSSSSLSKAPSISRTDTCTTRTNQQMFAASGRGGEISFKSHISLWEHTSHFKLIGRGVPSVCVVSQLVYNFLCSERTCGCVAWWVGSVSSLPMRGLNRVPRPLVSLAERTTAARYCTAVFLIQPLRCGWNDATSFSSVPAFPLLRCCWAFRHCGGKHASQTDT